jgi:hypothetical protein
MFSQTPLEQMPLVREHSSISTRHKSIWFICKSKWNTSQFYLCTSVYWEPIRDRVGIRTGNYLECWCIYHRGTIQVCVDTRQYLNEKFCFFYHFYHFTNHNKTWLNLPMQICIIMVLSKPSSQSQVKLPLVFWHVPLPQTPLIMLHSSISKWTSKTE